jgi:RNA polymerase subunit RPABC4/transcription elongation factor Spt4
MYELLEGLDEEAIGGKGELPVNIKKILDDSVSREKKLQSQLNVALKNVEELKKEMEDMDKNYYSSIKQEFQRLGKKREEEQKKEYEKKLKAYSDQDTSKIEDKYKKMLRKQEDKFKKELEIAAQTLFEMKQYVEELEQTSATMPPAPDIEQKYVPGSTPTIQNTPQQQQNNLGKRGVPVRLPKKIPKSGGAAKPKPPSCRKPQTIVIRKKKQRKNVYQAGKCGSCGEYIPIDSESCPNCGATFAKVGEELGVCGNCGEIIPASKKKCPSCGSRFE